MKELDKDYKQIFDELFAKQYKKKFIDLKLRYEHQYIKNMVSKMLKSEGGFVWACKGYDGEVQSSFIG